MSIGMEEGVDMSEHEVTRPHHFFHDVGSRWSWLTSGPIGYEYVIDADQATLAAALGIPADASEDQVKAALTAQIPENPAHWCDEHGIKYSLWDKWPFYAYEPGFTGTLD